MDGYSGFDYLFLVNLCEVTIDLCGQATALYTAVCKAIINVDFFTNFMSICFHYVLVGSSRLEVGKPSMTGWRKPKKNPTMCSSLRTSWRCTNRCQLQWHSSKSMLVLRPSNNYLNPLMKVSKNFVEICWGEKKQVKSYLSFEGVLSIANDGTLWFKFDWTCIEWQLM